LGIRHVEGKHGEFLSSFYHLMLMTRRRQGLPPQPLRWFQNLTNAFGNDLKIRMAFYNGAPIAAILTISHKRVLVYKYGCSDARYKHLGATPLLLWRAIQDAVEHGIVSLDMGRSDLENRGLIEFKERWGATATTLTYWRTTDDEHPTRRPWQPQIVKHIVSATPFPILRVVGNVLYRHFG
jgi:lipid II:glycine glycyltransferase (peptidoglycan interpeptide bridge formation enzyme)